MLHPLLQASLKELGTLPERKGEVLASVLAKYDGEAFSIDAAERPVERSQDKECLARNINLSQCLICWDSPAASIREYIVRIFLH